MIWYIVEGKGNSDWLFLKDDGLIVRDIWGVPVITGGPYLHMTGLDLEPLETGAWKYKSCQAVYRVGLRGGYGLAR